MEDEFQKELQKAMQQQMEQEAKQQPIPNPFVEQCRNHLWYVIKMNQKFGPYSYDDAFREVTHLNMGLRIAIAYMEIAS